MYSTSGVDAVATITELRSKTSELVEYVRDSQKGVLIQKNNEPYAVLLDWETYQEAIASRPEENRATAAPKRKKKSKKKRSKSG